jgi:hypothetical protein
MSEESPGFLEKVRESWRIFKGCQRMYTSLNVKPRPTSPSDSVRGMGRRKEYK